MARAALLVASTLLVGLATATFASAQADGGPTLERLSFTPVPGDYTFVVRLDGAVLAPLNATADADGEGHLVWYLEGKPCAGACSGGRDPRTDAPHFTYRSLKVGDELAVQLVQDGGAPFDPPVWSNVTVQPAGSTDGPLLAILGGPPNAGDYTMTVAVVRFTLLPPEADPDTADAGSLLYTRNGQPCDDLCSAGAYPVTNATTFTFHGVLAGDRLGVQLVRGNGTPVEPPMQAVQVVAVPSVRFTTAPPQEGDATLSVVVSGFTLQAPGGDDNAGLGHLRWLRAAKGTTTFQPFSGTCAPSAETTATTIRLCGLHEGDQVTAELVGNQGASLTPPVRASPQTVLRKPEQPLDSPAASPLFAVAALAIAALARRRA